MKVMQSLIAALSFGVSIFLLTGLTLVLSPGAARGEIAVGSAFFGDSRVGLESDGVNDDPTDGLGGPRAHFCGDPTDGLDFLGDPRDGLDHHKYGGDPGDGMDYHSLEISGDPDDGLDFPYGDPGAGLGYFMFLQLVWIP